jgi:hypothetical protein
LPNKSFFCQVFPNFSLAVLGDIKGLRGEKSFFSSIPNFLPRRNEFSPQGCGEARLQVAGKARIPERRGRGKPELPITWMLVFGNRISALPRASR